MHGKLLSEAGKHYGEGIIKEYSKKLTIEVGKKYNKRTLFRMRQFYNVFSNEKVTALRTQLSWMHYRELLSMKDFEKIKYYIDISIEQNLSYRELHNRIKSHEYERLPNNTKNKLITSEDKLDVQDLVKDPIVIKNTRNYEVINEKILK